MYNYSMRFYHLDTSSFGGMLTDGLLQIYSAQSSQTKLILVTKNKVASKFLLQFLGRYCIVLNSFLARKLYFALSKLKIAIFNNDFLNEKEYFENLCKAQRYLRVSLIESQKTNIFDNLIKTNNRPIVVFAVRTPYYSESLGNTGEHEITIRNCDQTWTERVIQLMIDNGFFVLRIGANSNPRLSITSPYFFDYSLSDFKNESNDFLICTLANMAVTNAGGISLMPSLLGIPGIVMNCGLFTDIHPQEYVHHFLPKSVFNKKSGFPLSSSDLGELDLRAMQKNSHYESLGLELRSITPDEAITAVLDFYSEIVDIKQSQNSKNNFKHLPDAISMQFPHGFVLPESAQPIEIKLHRLWKNF
jgi:putative glycosyltransferase (TIGR04372 family)